MNHLSHQKYRPDIDGLRAIAILAVMAFHFFPNQIKGGFVGVDIFFVISGFLISGIIFGKLEDNSFSYADFYARRIKRIFPALIIVLIFCFAFGWFVLFSDEFNQLAKHIAAGSGFIANIALWKESGYFDTAANLKPLLHLWSLGIEEQFYIFWPLILGIIWKRKIRFFNIAWLLGILSFALNLYAVKNNPIAAFYSPFARFWELMIGGCLAYLSLHKPQWLSRHSNLQSFIGLVLISIAIIFTDEKKAFPGWWALLPTFGSFFLIAAGNSAKLNSTILSSRFMVWIGLISYPLYLWHWPLLTFARVLTGGMPSKNLRMTLVVLSLFLAWVTYQCIEKRFRVKENKKAASLFAIVLLLFLTGTIVFALNLKSRHSEKNLESLITAASEWDFPRGLDRIQINKQSYYIKKSAGDTVLFAGDSHIEQYSPRINKLIDGDKETFRTVLFATSDGCPMIPNVYSDNPIHAGCDEFHSHLLKLIEDSEIKSVVIGGCWNCYFIKQARIHAQTGNEGYYYLENGGGIFLDEPRGAELAFESLKNLLSLMGRDKKVFLLLDNPYGEEFDPRNYRTGTRFGKIEITPLPKATALNEKQNNLRLKLSEIAANTSATLIDPMNSLCPNNMCLVSQNNGVPIYKDDNHLRPFYVRDFADFIDEAVEKP